MNRGEAAILIGGEPFSASADVPFVFGRTDAEGVVGLDETDMGISSVAGSIECAWGVWWVVNQSTKRPLLLELPAGPGQIGLAPGHRHAVTTERVSVIVPGAIYSHLVEVVLPATYTEGLRGDTARLTSGTLVVSSVNLSDRERDALTAMCAGYLESFPHRREHPNTYEESARLLSSEDWSADRVRKAIERVKDRFAEKEELYFSGPQANYDLARHLITSGSLTGADLARLPGRGR